MFVSGCLFVCGMTNGTTQRCQHAESEVEERRKIEPSDSGVELPGRTVHSFHITSQEKRNLIKFPATRPGNGMAQLDAASQPASSWPEKRLRREEYIWYVCSY